MKYNFIPDIAPRLTIAVSVFHAYAHQFCCQIAFHPWKQTGFGKSNGEGNERLWSSCVDTIEAENGSTWTLQELQEEKGLTVLFLKSQWEEQKRLQLSVKACTSSAFQCKGLIVMYKCYRQ